jgi:hypothetical protein
MVWRNLTRACIDHIVAAYKNDAGKYSKNEKKALSYANYFKNQSYISRLLESKLSGKIKKYSRAVLRA